MTIGIRGGFYFYTMQKSKHLALILCLLIFSQYLRAQEAEFKRHKIMVVLGHAMTPEGLNVDGKKTFLFLPSWGVDYDYRINEKWSVGIHTDIIIENFAFEDPNEIIQERSTPLALVVTGGYRIGEHLTAFLGAGAELAKEENLTVVRVGADYGWEVGKDWEVAVNYMIDFKIDAYNTGVFGVGIARSL